MMHVVLPRADPCCSPPTDSGESKWKQGKFAVSTCRHTHTPTHDVCFCVWQAGKEECAHLVKLTPKVQQLFTGEGTAGLLV